MLAIKTIAIILTTEILAPATFLFDFITIAVLLPFFMFLTFYTNTFFFLVHASEEYAQKAMFVLLTLGSYR